MIEWKESVEVVHKIHSILVREDKCLIRVQFNSNLMQMGNKLNICDRPSTLFVACLIHWCSKTTFCSSFKSNLIFILLVFPIVWYSHLVIVFQNFEKKNFYVIIETTYFIEILWLIFISANIRKPKSIKFQIDTLK